MDFGLAGQSIVVTGAGSNIGRAIALCLAREGANLTLGDIDDAQTEIVAAEAVQAGAPSAQFIHTDVTNVAHVGAMVAAAVEGHGGVDVLVNGVGLSIPRRFAETTPADWYRLIDVNLFGVLNCTSAALAHMIPRGRGAIVSVSSDASRQGEPGEAVYGAAKAGVNSFSKTIAREYGPQGIRANVVCPGATIPSDPAEVGAGSMWASDGFEMTAQRLERLARAVPLQKVGRSIDIANAVAFLASDRAAGHITGQVLSVSGGYTMVG